MGWERRKGKLFYYRKVRDEQGHVRSRYVGRGEKAIEASRADGVPVPDELLAFPLSEPVAQPAPADKLDELGRKKEGESKTQQNATPKKGRHYPCLSERLRNHKLAQRAGWVRRTST